MFGGDTAGGDLRLFWFFCQELSVPLPCFSEYLGKSHKTVYCTFNNLTITLLKRDKQH